MDRCNSKKGLVMTNNLFDKKFHNFDLITAIRRFYKLSSIGDQLIITNRDLEGPQIRPNIE
jgi:hypothetical protein